MKTSKNGIELIKTFEGCRLTAYKAIPEEKFFTIGYGHYGKDVKEGQKITKEQADALLIRDLSSYEKSVNDFNLDWMNQNRFDALVSFTYNCGAGNLKKLLDGGKRSASDVSEKLLAYNKASGRVLAGLTRRRKAERELFDKPMSSCYYRRYLGTSTRIDEVLKAIGVPSTLYGSVTKRRPIAVLNGFNDYRGTASQNLTLIRLAREGKLRCK